MVLVACTESHPERFVAIVFVSLALLYGFHLLSQSTSDASFKIVLYFFATARVILSDAKSWLSWIGLFDFRPDSAFFSVCLAPISSSQKVAVALFTPFFTYALLWVLAGIHYSVQRCGLLKRDVHMCCGGASCERQVLVAVFSLDSYRRTFVTLVLASYTALAEAVFRYMHCVDVPGADSVLFAEPALSCSSPAYRALYAWMICLLIVLIATPPALALFLVRSARAKRFADPTFHFRFGSIYSLYKAHVFWFESVAISRRAVITASVLVFAQVNERMQRRAWPLMGLSLFFFVWRAFLSFLSIKRRVLR